MLNFFALLLILPLSAESQTKVQATEIVEASPIESFSDQTGAWPVQDTDAEFLPLDSMSVFDSGALIPGVLTRGGSSRASPAFVIRGSRSSTRSLALLDGAPINLTDSTGPAELLIPRENISNIKIIKGPNSVLFGANATGGALNFVPATYQRARVRLGVGSFGQRSAFAASPLYSNEKNHVQISAFTDHNDGNFDYQQVKSAPRFSRQRNNQHLNRFHLSGLHNIQSTKVSYHLIHAEDSGSTPGATSFVDVQTYNKKSQLASIKAEQRFHQNWNVQLQNSYLSQLSEYRSETTNTDYFNHSISNWSQLSALYTNSRQLQIRTFLDHRHSELNATDLGRNKKYLDETEPGAIAQIPFDDGIIFQPGVRYLPLYGLVMKNAGVTRHTGPVRSYINYSEGFRPANLSDKYSRFGTFSGNPSLKPEESKQVEAGFDRSGARGAERVLDKIAYSANLFQNHYINLIEVNSAGTSTVNNAEAFVYGFELGFGLPLDILDFDLYYTYTEAEDKSRKPLANIADHQLVVGVTHYFGPLAFDLRHTWIEGYHMTSVPSDTRTFNSTDFTFRTLGLTDWVLRGGVYNMFDEPKEYIRGYPEPQRRYVMTVERLF